MKKFIYITMFLNIISNANAQYQSVIIYTPNNTPVQVGNFIGTDYTTVQKNESKNYWLS
jgi:hypothetical protein